MKKKLLSLLVVLTMLMMLFVGCAEETSSDRDRRSSSSRSKRDRDDDDDDEEDDDGRSLADLIRDKIGASDRGEDIPVTRIPVSEERDDDEDWYYKDDDEDWYYKDEDDWDDWDDDDDDWSPTPTLGITPIPARDLGGMQIIIGDHWSLEDPVEPKNAQEEATAKYRQEIFAKYNFIMQSKCVAGWGEMTDLCVNSITAGEPAAQLFELDYRFIAKPMQYGLFYDLSTLDELDFSEEKWNKAVKGIMTKGDSIYGMRAAASEPRGGVIWNKRLFEEAGLDPDLPYDLQASGDWTWSKFEELCAQLTCDTNNDGVTDVYATVSQGASTMTCLVASTGEDFFGKDANGNLTNNMMSSRKVLDALNFAVELYNKGYEMPTPEGANWDWFYAAFREGKAAMTFNEEYTCQPTQAYGEYWMEDEVGFVMPPKPDGQNGYHSYVCDSIVVIPSCYDSETAADIAFAYNVYTMATPGYDDPDAWKESYYAHFSDERAVDETIAMFNDGVSTHFLNQTLIDYDLGPDLLWVYPFANVTPADQIASIKDAWDAIIAEANYNW